MQLCYVLSVMIIIIVAPIQGGAKI